VPPEARRKTVSEKVETETIWHGFHDRLLGYIRSRVGSDDQAEDVLQEVFLSVHANLNRLDDDQSLAAWIWRITSNAVVDHYRERAKFTEATSREDLDAAQLVNPGADEEWETSAEDRAALAHCVQSLVEHLPGPYREAVTLTELQGLSQREAAAALGLTLSGAKSRVQRGRDKLKKLLLRCCHDELYRGRGFGDQRPSQGAENGNCRLDCGCEAEQAEKPSDGQG